MEHLYSILKNIQSGRPEKGWEAAFQEFLSLLQKELVRLAGVDDDEVAVLFMDKRQNLKFYRPRYLENSGVIPAGYTRAFVIKVLQLGQPAMENRFNAVTHLALFEEFKRDNPQQLPIQKMMCFPVASSDGRAFGAVEISRKGASPDSAGPDWTKADLERVQKALSPLGEGLFQLCRMADKI